MSLVELERYLGAPRGYSEQDAWAQIEVDTGVLPQDYMAFAAAYGPGAVGEFLYVFHPNEREESMFDTMRSMAPLYQQLVPDGIPHGVFPASVPGMVQWASTAQGDACFLIPGSQGSWNIGVWFRQWAQWEEYEMSVTAWLAGQLSGSLKIDGLPLFGGGFRPAD